MQEIPKQVDLLHYYPILIFFHLQDREGEQRAGDPEAGGAAALLPNLCAG